MDKEDSTAPKMVSTTVYIYESQAIKLKQLRARTRVSIAEYIRQGVELMLKQHRESGVIDGDWDRQIPLPLSLEGSQNVSKDKGD